MPISTVKEILSPIRALWRRARAVVEGEAAVKALDDVLDLSNFTNVLIPFSNTMKVEKYRFYKAEAEFPGLVSQYVKIIIGGLLRKPPTLTITNLYEEQLDESMSEEAREILNNARVDYKDIIRNVRENLVATNSGLLSFTAQILEEELTTSRSAVTLAYRASKNKRGKGKAYPVFWKAEEIINWKVVEGELTRVVFKYKVERDDLDDPYANSLVTRYQDHFMDNGVYKVATYEEVALDARPTTGVTNRFSSTVQGTHEVSIVTPKINNETFTYLPVWFMNGSVEPIIPMLTPMIDTELQLYNRISRSNHLLNTAAAFTPIVFTSMDNPTFQEISRRGLGNWIKLNQEDKVGSFDPPIEALQHMEKAIVRGFEKLARMGTSILSGNDKMTNVAATALSLRMSPQMSQLGLLNTKVSSNIEEILEVLIKWNYNEDVDVSFNLSADFSAPPLNSDWLRIIGEWVEARILPRSEFINILKKSDILDEGYDDEKGQEELRNIDIVTGMQNVSLGLQLPTEEDDEL